MASEHRLDVLEEAVSSSAVVAAAQARVDRLRALVRARAIGAEFVRRNFTETSAPPGLLAAHRVRLTAAQVALMAAVRERQRRVVAWLAHTQGGAHGKK